MFMINILFISRLL